MGWQRYIGRVFELIVLSFIRDVSQDDILLLMQQPPFYSVASYTGWNGYSDDENEGEESMEGSESLDLEIAITKQQDVAIKQLSEEINKWRGDMLASEVKLSPWLVFNAMQRCFSVDFPQQLNSLGANSPLVRFEGVFRSFGFAFFNVWAAFAYMEKGALFGVSDAVSNSKLLWKSIYKEVKYKEADVYKQNIAPLLGSEDTRASVTYLLSRHPLHKMALESFLLKVNLVQKETVPTEAIRDDMQKNKLSSRNWLKQNLLASTNLSDLTGMIELTHIVQALEEKALTFKAANQLFNNFIAEYKQRSELAPRFEEAIKRVYKRPPELLDKPTE